MRSLLADIKSPHMSTDVVRAVRESVVANLRGICATPRGTVLLGSDYGIDDPMRVFHEYPGGVTAMQDGLVRTLGRYEPRLANVSITHIPSDDLELVLHFEIHGTLVVDGAYLPVRFTSTIDSDNWLDIC